MAYPEWIRLRGRAGELIWDQLGEEGSSENGIIDHILHAAGGADRSRLRLKLTIEDFPAMSEWVRGRISQTPRGGRPGYGMTRQGTMITLGLREILDQLREFKLTEGPDNDVRKSTRGLIFEAFSAPEDVEFVTETLDPFMEGRAFDAESGLIAADLIMSKGLEPGLDAMRELQRRAGRPHKPQGVKRRRRRDVIAREDAERQGKTEIESMTDSEIAIGISSLTPARTAKDRNRRHALESELEARHYDREMARGAERRGNPTGLITQCQAGWERYCERPGKGRLKEVLAHLETMKTSGSAKVKLERQRCLRVANQEAKELGL